MKPDRSANRTCDVIRAGRPQPASLPDFDVPTLAAYGASSGLLMLAVHEVLGHSLATVLLGAHLVHVTSVDSSYSGPASPVVMRLIAGAGIAANIIVGALVVAAARVAPAGAFQLRYFAWFFGHATLFMGSAYLVGFTLLPFGDVHAAIGGLPFEVGLEIVLVVLGIAVYYATLRDAGRTLGRWIYENDASAPRLTLTPYLAMGITTTLAALFNPSGPFNGALWAAAATFGANAGFLNLENFTSGGAAAEANTFRVKRNLVAIVCGVAATVVSFAVFGPGIPR